MKRFTKINEGFICEVCGADNPPADKTCRNHCRQCLCSKHVDKNPGDRAEMCHGVLRPIGLETNHGVMQSIRFRCQKCGTEGRNKIADDDNRESLFALIENA